MSPVLNCPPAEVRRGGVSSKQIETEALVEETVGRCGNGRGRMYARKGDSVQGGANSLRNAIQPRLTIPGDFWLMPNYRRTTSSPRPVFFTVCLADRGSTALLYHLDVLREAVRIVLKDRPFDILAWVVLPDHMHAVWRLREADPNYSQCWGRIKSRFSRDARRAGLVPPPFDPGTQARKGELGIWQPRFREHHCRDERDLRAHIRYCWGNPVKHGLAARPADWPRPRSIATSASGWSSRNGAATTRRAAASARPLEARNVFRSRVGRDKSRPTPWLAMPGGTSLALRQRHLANFLYFTRFGSSASGPRRRFLSSS
jgi:putative transposase